METLPFLDPVSTRPDQTNGAASSFLILDLHAALDITTKLLNL
jgi:hypothetical protein